MNCSVFSDSIDIILPGKDKAGRRKPRVNLSNSLQNSDINRLQLASLLRQNQTPQTKKTRKIFWSAFINKQCHDHANCNK